MEEIQNHQIYMLFETLTDHFNQEQWSIISGQTPEEFLKKQNSILNKLLEKKQIFEKYFYNFYSNHVKLLDWSLLAGQLKSQISPYIFKPLVSKGSNFFSRKIKQVFEIKLKRKKQQKQEQINRQRVKEMQQQVYKQFFNDMLASTCLDQSHKYNNMKALLKNKQAQKMDGHEFYIKTFNACNGWKYIFYNYQKHMKGLRQKFKYNQKIRSNQHKALYYRKSSDDLGLLEYEHDNTIRINPKVHHLNQVIRDKKLNSLKGFKSVVKNSTRKKIFFQNHQGKPITYRVARQ